MIYLPISALVIPSKQLYSFTINTMPSSHHSLSSTSPIRPGQIDEVTHNDIGISINHYVGRVLVVVASVWALARANKEAATIRSILDGYADPLVLSRDGGDCNAWPVFLIYSSMITLSASRSFSGNNNDMMTDVREY